jgi:hypothetical protein
MTVHQARLLAEAKGEWSRGLEISTNLFAIMTKAGLDVEGYKEIYFKSKEEA